MGLTESVLDLIADRPADALSLGARYTAVRVGERVGVARTMRARPRETTDIDRLAGKKLARLILSDDPIEASIGAAAINAQTFPDGKISSGNIFKKIIQMAGRFESTGVVGWFPFVRHLKGRVHVFEKRPRDGCLAASEAETILPGCDLVIITGSAFVNKTLERLLQISRGYTLVIGPSTPLSPVLFEFGADMLAGIISNSGHVLDIVGHDGGTKDFIGFADSVIMEPDQSAAMTDGR
jgi:uncharacterized protein (DUF4213/DUF364 family)